MPLQFQSQKTQEFHQQNQEKPVIHQESVIKVMNGVSETKELIKSTSSTPIASPKPARKSTAPRFITPLNGKIVDQGADVILDGIVDGKCFIVKLEHVSETRLFTFLMILVTFLIGHIKKMRTK